MTDWQPNEHQQHALSLSQDADYALSVTDLCKEVGVSRQAYSLWFNTPGFVKWWGEAFERHMMLALPRMYGAVMERASGLVAPKSGSPQDAKLLMERFDKGYAPRSRQEVTGEGGEALTLVLKRREGDGDGSGKESAAD